MFILLNYIFNQFKMPQPKPGESKNDYLKRCIPELIYEGRQQNQAIAICYAMYDKRNDKNYKNHKNHKKENMSKSDKTKLYVAHY